MINALNNQASLQNQLYDMASSAGKPVQEDRIQNLAQTNAQVSEQIQANRESQKSLEQRLLQMAHDINKKMKDVGTDIKFSYNDDIKGLVVTIKELDGGRIVREIPSREAIDLVRKMNEVAGLLVDMRI